MENKDIIEVFAGEDTVVDENGEEVFVPHNPLERPEIHYAKPVVTLVIFVAQLVGLLFIPYGEWWIAALVLTGYTLLYFAVIAKRTIIWLVHLYQNKAPDEVRLKCAMEPSCSVYMILAVEKYGVIRGLYKGIGRLFRCGDEQGVDYP